MSEFEKKVEELSRLAGSLPAGPQKVVMERMLGKLKVTANALLLPDGSPNPSTESLALLLPQRGLTKDYLSDGDGYAVSCC